MAKTDNLGDFLKDVADSIRTKTGTTELINAQDFSDKILNISSGENTLKNLLDATESCKYLFYGYNLATSVDNLIQPSDTENVTTMEEMFGECRNLYTIPLLDTSKVTNMREMFSYCNHLSSVPLLDTSKVTDMYYMFNNCEHLSSVPLLDTSKVTNMYYMFNNCKALKTLPQLNTNRVTNMSGMFFNCVKITEAPMLDTHTVIFTVSMFNGCTNLTTVPAYNMVNNGQATSMFDNCPNLKSILMTGMTSSFDISSSTKFEREDLVTILNNLGTPAFTRYLTMGATNLAKLTDEDKAIATNKKWTLS